jgi:hypothetical protein
VGKRRTRKQKQLAKHQFSVSWSPRPERSLPEANVKSQIKIEPEASLSRGQTAKKAKLLAKEASFEAYGRDTLKSLFLASLILAAELVLYLAWN